MQAWHKAKKKILKTSGFTLDIWDDMGNTIDFITKRNILVNLYDENPPGEVFAKVILHSGIPAFILSVFYRKYCLSSTDEIAAAAEK